MFLIVFRTPLNFILKDKRDISIACYLIQVKNDLGTIIVQYLNTYLEDKCREK